MSDLSKPAIQRLEAWMGEITDLLAYQPEIPVAHKTVILDALHAFKRERQTFTPPEPDRSECEKAFEKWCSSAVIEGSGNKAEVAAWIAAWSAATERACKVVDERYAYVISDEARQDLISKIRAQ